MGLFDFLSSKPTPKKIDKIARRMLNEHHQQQVRQEAIEELIAFGTPEAIAALVRRLGTNFRDTIKNEQEKRYIDSVLVERFADRAVAPLEEYVRTEHTISAAIRTLDKLVSDERLVTVCIETLEGYPPSDHRSIDAKLQLVDALADYDDPRVVPAVLPHALDHDDDIRVKTIDLLEARVDKSHPLYGEVVEVLIKAMQDALASGRIVRRAARALAALDVDLSDRREALLEFVPDGFTLGEDGRLSGQ